jgi:hypothetical protein
MPWTYKVVCWMALVVGVAVAAGCNKSALREKPPPDPLLTSKKPIEGKPLVNEVSPAPAEDYSPPPRPVVDDEPRAVRVLGVRPVGERR